MGESDSRPPDANRVHYHYANGPFNLMLKAYWRKPPDAGYHYANGPTRKSLSQKA